MMVSFKKLYFSLIVSALSVFGVSEVLADNVAIHTPEGFQVLSVSPNGKWACGVYIDAMMNTNPFRWNLESGSIEVLGSESGTAWDIANDGTISGDYPDTDVYENHAPVRVPCYWRGTTRYKVELPSGKPTDAMGLGITPDGRYMSGSVCVNGIYSPYIWHDGKITRSFGDGNHGVPYCISPDGQAAAGWNMVTNRVACYWPAKGNIIYFQDSPESTGPWCYSRNFSPDGKKIVYWGGYEMGSDGRTLYLYAIYDVVTGERKKVVVPSTEYSIEFYDISNNETLVGTVNSRGYLNVAGTGMFIDDYLKARGIDIRALCDNMYDKEEYYVGQLPISNVMAVSEDEKVLLMQYYDTLGQMCSMALKMDQDFTSVTPTEVKAEQLQGLHTVGITWKRPVGANNIRGYNVYRDGKKLNVLPLNQLCYYDSKLANGEYAYEVSAVTTGGVETKATEIKVNVADAALVGPYSLFARQKGINNGYLAWKTPLSNLVHKRYYDIETTDYSGFAIYEDLAMEVAVSYTKDEMKNYADYNVSEISFVPMGAHKSWAVNLYTTATDGSLQLLYSQPVSQQIVYGALNTVKLTTPQAVPQGDLIVAIEVNTDADVQQVIGTQTGVTVPGHSDLLRRKTDKGFTSAYESSVASGISLSCLSWAIDLGLEATAGSNATLSGYNVTIDGKSVAKTSDNTIELKSLADGNYTVGVEAEYSDGTKSAAQTAALAITAKYPAVVDVTVSQPSNRGIAATWKAPKNNDATFVSHAGIDKFSRGIHGNSSTSYAFMAAAEYLPNKLRGYDGYRIAAFRFYPMSDAIFTFYLYENGKQICEFEAEKLTYKAWNTCYLPKDIYINENSEYRLVIDCFDPEPNADVLAIDTELPLEYVSDLVSTDNGETWNSLSIESGANGNWMMGMLLETTTGEDLVIDGYDFNIDGKARNTEKIKGNTYENKLVFDGTHTLRIDTWYAGLSKPVQGDSYTFRTGAAAIESVSADTNIRLVKGTNFLQVEGDGVKAIEIVNTAGVVEVRATGAKVNISSLADGVYIVKIATANGIVLRKFNN